jgi:hypothetical protein
MSDQPKDSRISTRRKSRRKRVPEPGENLNLHYAKAFDESNEFFKAKSENDTVDEKIAQNSDAKPLIQDNRHSEERQSQNSADSKLFTCPTCGVSASSTIEIILHMGDHAEP